VDLEALSAAGLYDAAAPAAGQRLELLEFLTSQGAAVEEMVAAHARGRLFALSGDRIVIPGRDEFSLADIAARTGADLETVTAIWRALGFVDPGADEGVASEADVEAVRTIVEMVALMGVPGVLGVCRVIAAGLTRISEAVSTVVRSQLPALALQVSGSEARTAEAFGDVAGFVPRIGGALDALFRHHLESARLNWERSDSGDIAEAGGVRLGVGFADLAGFTGLTESLTLPELSSLLTVFEEVADEVVRAEGGRVVKYIGDAVMFVTHAAPSAVRVARGLIEAAETRGMQARVGVAIGTVLALEGDYFGPVVNLAARLVSMADAGEVLVTGEVVERLDGEVETVALGARAVRGFSQPIELARLR
jgi:class 3 adenylate cyclase